MFGQPDDDHGDNDHIVKGEPENPFPLFLFLLILLAIVIILW